MLMNKLALAVISSAIMILPITAYAQNRDSNFIHFGNQNGGVTNFGNSRSGFELINRGYQGTIRNHDNNTTTRQQGSFNSNSRFQQTGNCATGNCSYSSSFSSNTQESSRTTTGW